MSIELTCSSCARRLRLNDKLAGKRVKCPDCRSILRVPIPGESVAPRSAETVPTAAQPSAPAPTTAPPDLWHVKTGEGDLYGPVDKQELDTWVAEGRIDAHCQILREGADQWQWADALYPFLSNGMDESRGGSTDSAVSTADTGKIDARQAEKFRDTSSDEPSASDNSMTTRSSQATPQRRQERTSSGKKTGVSPSADGELSDRSQLIAGLLALFLGTLGIHRIYLGYVPLGLIMLFTLGGCGIWSLIDAILIFTGKVPDAQGRRLRP